MGINGLNKILKDYSQNKPGIKEVDLNIYRGKCLAIDINIYLYGFAYNPLQKKPNSHIDGFFQMICDLLKNGILPVMIFDGKPPKAKADTMKDRTESRQELQDKAMGLAKEIDALMNKLEELEKCNDEKLPGSQSVPDSKSEPEPGSQSVPVSESDALIKEISQKQTEMEKYLKRDIKIESSMYSDIKVLFALMGVPYLQAIGEADALCVRLYNNGFVSGVLSEDMDILPFSGKLIRGIKEKRILTVTEYNLPDLLNNIGLTQAQLVDLCILCGCDYSCKIKNIGPKTAVVLLQKYGNIEGILEKHIIPSNQSINPNQKSKYDKENIEQFKKEFPDARAVFLETPGKESLDNMKEKLVLGKLNQDELLPLLKTKCKYRSETLEKKMKEINHAYSMSFSGVTNTTTFIAPPKIKPKIILKAKQSST